MIRIMADPTEIFKGTILFIIPHMDDEALACGGIIAKLPQKEQIHLVYATDGMKSPAPIMPGKDAINSNLGEVRVQESVAAMRLLGVPQQNLHFFRLPEGELRFHITRLKDHLLAAIAIIRPDYVFIPFRYDRHLDHLAINRVVLDALHQGFFKAQVVEYFVYYRSRLLPKRDIRKYIQPHHLIKIDIKDVSKQKRAALDCFKSQTTIYYSWQTRPILTDSLLEEECQNPEYFLLYNPSFPGSAVFASTVLWIRIAHRIEPVLQKWKYLTGAFIKRLVHHGA
jgi:LmbE family N-acetylglucosaminyl deacetylase